MPPVFVPIYLIMFDAVNLQREKMVLTAVFPLLLLLISACTPRTQASSPPLPTIATIATIPVTATATPSPVPSPTLRATATPLPSPTATATPLPTATTTPSPTPTAIPIGEQINGVHIDDFAVLSPAVQTHVREIYELGQEEGRNSQAFSKLGDSSMASPNYLVRMGQYDFDLGEYAFLQETIDKYQISLRRLGPTAIVGLHATSVFSPDLLNPAMCDVEEDGNMLDCEFRLQNPSIMIIALGTNDEHELFEERLGKIVEYSAERGIIPVLVTKADRHEGEDNRNNISIRAIAAQQAVPLLDFDLLADTLPNRGLGHDNVHLTEHAYYEYSSPEAFESGYSILNLSTMMMLDAIQSTVLE